MFKRMFPVFVSTSAILICFFAVSPIYAQRGDSVAPTPIQQQIPAINVVAPLQPQEVAPAPVIEGIVVNLESFPHYSGQEAVVTMNKTMVLRTDGEWQGAWMQTGSKPPGPLPGKSIAVAVFLGKRPSESYSVRINEAIVNGNDMIVKFFENKPSMPHLTKGNATSPWVIQVLPAVDGRVRFLTANVVR